MSWRSTFDVQSLLAMVRGALDRPGPGAAVVDLPVGAPPATRVVLELLQAAGFVPVRTGSLAADGDPGGRLGHRHVALIVGTRDERALAAAWVKRLARVSPRGHLVVVFPDTAGERPGTPPMRPARPGVATGTGDPWRRVVGGTAASIAGDARYLARLMAEASLERADAWVAALRVEAHLLTQPLRDEALQMVVWLRVWQSRYEEADAACRQIGHDGRRRALGSVINRKLCRERLSSGVVPSVPLPTGAARPSIFGVAAMYLLPAVPSLLQSLAEADDDLCALRAGATWAIDRAGARGVAFVGADDGRLATAVGWGGQAPSPADRLQAARSQDLERHDRGTLVLVIAPVRQAGVHIGAVLVLGPADCASTASEAASTLALLCAAALRLRIDQLAATRQIHTRLPEIIGDSPVSRAVRDAVARAASTPFPVLVEGESGTGKELVARALHRLSARRDRRFVAVNSAALSDELVEAELFGHSRGAFTGAVAPRAGLFEEAHGGTLFLDEVADLSARAQAKLLRVLQEHEVRRVGENHPRAIDVRVVAATNRPLAEACAAGAFRDDLRFRLAVVRIRLPPLRERAEDIAPLARAFWGRTIREVGKRAVLGADALARLAAHGWPGNVRELQNVVAGLALVAPVHGRVASRHVDLVLATSGVTRHAPPMSLDRARRACDRQAVTAALARHAGSRSAAARELGLTRQGLAKIIRRLRLDDGAVEGVA